MYLVTISYGQEHCKWASYVVLERRANLGGTWDLNRFPGIRSDSDMYTFGFAWKAWKSPKLLSPAEDIRAYLKARLSFVGHCLSPFLCTYRLTNLMPELNMLLHSEPRVGFDFLAEPCSINEVIIYDLK